MASKINSKECPQFLNDFFTYQRVVKVKAERTLESYFIDLRLFLRYLKIFNGAAAPETPFKDITISDVPLEWVEKVTDKTILAYLSYVATDRKNNSQTRHRKLASLKVFYKCLRRNLEIINTEPMKDVDYPKLGERLPKYLSLNDSIRLLTNMNPEHLYYYRDYCMITLFVNCGMRLSELVGLNIQDVNLDERTMRLLGKGNKERIIHINDACADALAQYLELRRPLDENIHALFLSKRGTRITNRRVQQIVDDALRDSHLDHQGYSTHKLRHTAATLMYQHGGVDTLVLKEILGHKSVATTEIYTHVANEALADAMDASPLSSIQNHRRHK